MAMAALSIFQNYGPLSGSKSNQCDVQINCLQAADPNRPIIEFRDIVLIVQN